MRVEHHSEFRKLVQQAVSQGWAYEMTTKSHWKFKSPDGVTIVILAGSPSSQKVWKNFVAQLRRGGFRRAG